MTMTLTMTTINNITIPALQPLLQSLLANVDERLPMGSMATIIPDTMGDTPASMNTATQKVTMALV